MTASNAKEPSARGVGSTFTCAWTSPSGNRPSSSATISGPKLASAYGSVPRATSWVTAAPALQSTGAPERGNSTVGGRMPTLMNTGLLVVAHWSCDSDSLCQPALGSTGLPDVSVTV